MKVLKSFYLSSRFFIVAASLVFLFVLSYFSPQLLVITNLLFAAVFPAVDALYERSRSGQPP